MKRILFIILVLTSLQGFAQPGFTGYTSQNTWRGVNATLKAGLPADTFNVTGSLKAYKWIALKRDTIWVWSQVSNRWLKAGGGGSSADNFRLPLQRVLNVVGIAGLSTVGEAGQVPTSNGTIWNYQYPFNGDSARMYSFETKGRLYVLDGGANLDTLAIDGTVITNYAQKTSAYTITVNDHTIHCTSGSFVVTLPTAAGIAGQEFLIKNTGAGTIIVDGNGSETIDGGANYSLSQNKYLRVKSTGAAFIITGNN